MAKKGYISEQMYAGRILSHGKITSLASGFALRGGKPFTLFINPKKDAQTLAATLNVKCSQDDDFAEAPFACGDWSPLALAEIAPGQESILDENDLYWGCGDYAEAVI